MENKTVNMNAEAKQVVMDMMNRIMTEPQNHSQLAGEIKQKFPIETFMQISMDLLGHPELNLPQNTKILMSVLMKQMIKQAKGNDEENATALLENVIKVVSSVGDFKSKMLFADSLENILPRVSPMKKISMLNYLCGECNKLLYTDNFDANNFNFLVSYMICLNKLFKDCLLVIDEAVLDSLEHMLLDNGSKSFPFSNFLLYLTQLDNNKETYLKFYFDEFLNNLFISLQFSKTISKKLVANIDIWIDFFNVCGKIGDLSNIAVLNTFALIDQINTRMAKVKNFEFIDLFLEKYSNLMINSLFSLLKQLNSNYLSSNEDTYSVLLRTISLLISNQQGKIAMESKIPFIVKELILPSIKITETDKENIIDNPVEYVNYRFDCVDLKRSKTVKTNAFLLLDTICEKYPEFLYFFFKLQTYIILNYLNSKRFSQIELAKITYGTLDSTFFRFIEDEYELVSTAFQIITSLSYLINENEDYIQLLSLLFKQMMESANNVNIDNNGVINNLVKHLLSNTYLLFTFMSDLIAEEEQSTVVSYLQFGFTYLKDCNEFDILSIQIVLTFQKICGEDCVQEFILQNFSETVGILINKLVQFNLTEIFDIIKEIADIDNEEANFILFQHLITNIDQNLTNKESDFSKLLDICTILLERNRVNRSSQLLFAFLENLILFCKQNIDVLHINEIFTFLAASFKTFEGLESIHQVYLTNLTSFSKTFGSTFKQQLDMLFAIQKNNKQVLFHYIPQLNSLCLRLSANIFSHCIEERKASLVLLLMLFKAGVIQEEIQNKINNQFICFIKNDLKLNIEAILIFDFVNQTGHGSFEKFFTLFNSNKQELREYLRLQVYLLLNKKESSIFSFNSINIILLKALDSDIFSQIEQLEHLKLITLLLLYNQKRSYPCCLEEKDELNYQLYNLFNLHSIDLDYEDYDDEDDLDVSVLTNEDTSDEEEAGQDKTKKSKFNDKGTVEYYDKVILSSNSFTNEYIIFKQLICNLQNNNNEVLKSISSPYFIDYIRQIHDTNYFVKKNSASIRKIVKVNRN